MAIVNKKLNISESGVSMLLALIALLILSLGSAALVRSIETGTVIIGNIALKQDGIESSAIAAELATDWIASHNDDGVLDSNSEINGYYASSLDKLDPTGSNTSSSSKLPQVNWDGNCQGLASSVYENCDTLPFNSQPINGNQIQWVITRMCDAPGPASAANLCSRSINLEASIASEKGDLIAGGRITGSESTPFYRIIIRSVGPRNTISFTETIIRF